MLTNAECFRCRKFRFNGRPKCQDNHNMGGKKKCIGFDNMHSPSFKKAILKDNTTIEQAIILNRQGYAVTHKSGKITATKEWLIK